MIVDRLRSRELDGRVERSARLRWRTGERELRIELPADHAGPPDDGAPFLAAAVQLAMRRGEDLTIEAPVSARLLDACDEIQRIYAAWAPELRPAEIHTAGTSTAAAARGGSGCFFSRGVDSMFSALCERSDPLTTLIFCDGLDPNHDDDVRAEEIRLAGQAAAAIGLPLVVAATNIRDVADEVVPDWEDFVAPGLAFVAHSLSGGISRAVIPSSDTYATLEPCGTSPLLDPLFSSEAVEIEHDSLACGRGAKIAWLSEQRPDVLRWLKVCFFVNSPGNCGECGKCLLTMAELLASGTLSLAEGFPSAIDLDAVRRMRVPIRKARIDWQEGVALLEAAGGHAELLEAIAEALERGTRRFQDELRNGPLPGRSFRSSAANSYLALLPRAQPIGLVRSVAGGRHAYSAGELGPGLLTGELGGLHPRPGEGSVAVWITPDRRVVTEAYVPSPRRSSRADVLRWVLAPLAWRGFPGLAARIGAVPRRVLALLRPSRPCEPPSGEPAGFIHRDAAPERLPLYSAVHPITGDQLLSSWQWEPVDLGYVDVMELGYLDPLAPVTGQVGIVSPPLVWASRFGQRVRSA